MFFLMCSERSGSNLITRLLNGHSKICGPATKHIVNPVVRNLFRYEPLDDEAHWDALLTDIHRLISVNFSVWKRSFSLEDLKQLGPVGDVASLIRNIFAEEAKANGKQHVFIKENHVYEFLPYLLLKFPEARYLYLTRDPRDMALSWKNNSDHPGGVVKAARQWQKDQQNSLKHYHVLKSVEKACFLRYEELIAEPVRCLEAILSFFGLNYEESMMNFYMDEMTQRNAGMQKAWSNLARGVLSDNKEKYLGELTEREIKAIEKICYFEMKILDYQPRFSLEELNDFSEGEVSGLESDEDSTIPLQRSEGVRKNMEAKAIFYRKVL
ncbi:MAG: sulfotransferase family protein [Gammaproteobacteria bacterium]